MSESAHWSDLLKASQSADPAEARAAREILYAAIRRRMGGLADRRAQGVPGAEGADLLQSVFCELELRGIAAEDTAEMERHLARKLIDKRIKRLRKRAEAELAEGDNRAAPAGETDGILDTLAALAELERAHPDWALAIKARMIDDPTVAIDAENPESHRQRLLPRKRTFEEAGEILIWKPSRVAGEFYEGLRWLAERDPELFGWSPPRKRG